MKTTTSTATENTPTPVTPTATTALPYAGFGQRFLAYIIDSFIIGLISIAFSSSFIAGRSAVAFGPGVLVAIVYYVFFWAKQDGQTLGNKMMAIKVVHEDGTPLNITTGIVRYIG